MGFAADFIRKAVGLKTEDQCCRESLIEFLALHGIRHAAFNYVTGEPSPLGGPSVNHRTYYGKATRGTQQVFFIAQVDANLGVGIASLVANVDDASIADGYALWKQNDWGGSCYGCVAAGLSQTENLENS